MASTGSAASDIYLGGYSEKAVAPHSCTLAWKIPWMEEPGRLKSMGSLRVGQFYPSYLVIVVQYRQRVQKVSALMIMVYTF